MGQGLGFRGLGFGEAGEHDVYIQTTVSVCIQRCPRKVAE